ncbi:restriction endonuclease subunit S [Mixta calida]|uniref:restriction endonuclease subunit S n=1 Tax=Mixta calida TaxID=665913 RepID=UPI0013317383|nr:restriction endonuclease subunit S [Mixta calida]
MSWPMIPLGELVNIKGGGTPDKSNSEYWNGEIPWASVKDFKKNTLDSTLDSITLLGAKNSATSVIPAGNIIIPTRMALGKVAINTIDLAINQDLKALSIKDNNVVDRDYLFRWLESQSSLIESEGKGATVKGITLPFLKGLNVPIPPLNEQKRIAAIFEKVDSIRQKCNRGVKLADDLLHAIFLDMFGDPVENPKGWVIDSLFKYGAFRNGMNFSKGESGATLKCLGVGDFKSLATITCMDNIGEIKLNTLPSDDYLLKDGDIVFVRSNGNKALVGRCLTIYPGKGKVTFSGFCIRYRIENPSLLPEYLNFLFRTPSMKQQMLSGGQGANIQNISQGTLSALRIPVPPLEKQLAFSKVVSFHWALMEKLDINTAKTEDMFDSISQQYFN